MFNLQLNLAFHYLWGRKLRTFLTTLAIILGTLAIFGTNMLIPTMMESFQVNLLAASGQVDVTVTQKDGEAFSRNTLNRLNGIAGIRVTAGSLSRTINIPDSYYAQAKITAITLTGIDPRVAEALRSYPIKQGRFLRTSDERAAVISASLANELGIQLNDEFAIPTVNGDAKLRVVGLLPERSLPGNEEVLITLYEAQKLLDLPNRINTIEINLLSLDTDQREAIQNQIQSALGSNFTLGGMSGQGDMLASMQIGQLMFNMFGFMALFMGGFIIFNTFRTIVAERRHDIGMLRAIGANRSTMIGIILTEGLVQGAVGTLIGIVLGYLMGVGLLVLMDPIFSQFLHLDIQIPAPQPGLIITTMILGVGATLAAGLLPALSASRVSPLEALRPNMADTGQNIRRKVTIFGAVLIALALLGLISGNTSLTLSGGLFFFAGLVLVAPALIRPITVTFSTLIAAAFAREGTGTLAQSNITRQASRAAITASTTMIGLAVIVGLGGMVWSLSGGFLDIMQRSLGSDYLIMPPSVGLWNSNIGAKEDLANRLRAVPGVNVVSSLRFAAASTDGQSISLLGIDPEAYPKVSGLTFQQGSSNSAYVELSQDRTLIANGVFASQMGLKVGDSILLSTPAGQKPYRVVAIGGDYLNAKIMTAYTSQSNLRKDFHKTEDVFIQLNLDPGIKSEQVEPRLKKILEDYSQFKLISGRGYFDETRQLFSAIFSFYFVLLSFLATPSLIALLNTLTIGVIERTREIGMLRAIGATQKQVRRMIIAESLLLAVIGTLLGLVAGLYLGYVMVLGFSVSGFPVTYVFPIQGLAAAIVVGLTFGVIAARLPARQAAALDIVRALRYE